MANELILIVEDNEVNRVLVRDMLRFKGYQTLEAQSGKRVYALPEKRSRRSS